MPFDWRKDLTEEYLSEIRFICLAMTEGYIDSYFEDILGHASDVESRLDDSDCTAEWLKEINRQMIDGFTKSGERVILIDSDYKTAFDEAMDIDPV